ncbi:adhesion protein FadA [Leptotrichia sp. oral taxon 221]|uniref:adhesion protein FadA n=1 Tax=Leptotrichia sp. oral taxon 221 TaxID=712362 RepID=UPI001B8AF7B8|nr:adhesion protein FadA [Leptotrichia sp. oral taxon 221]QUB97204.1 adhesion protein FadA [Leptotrichia sp. oral taxon 221]
MKKALFMLVGMTLLSSVSYSAPVKNTNTNSLESSLNAIENKFNDLLQKEAQKKAEFQNEKDRLEKEVEDLQNKLIGKEKLQEKLKKDSEVRWHRDEYKKILKNYDEYYKNLEKTIVQKQTRIAELETLLSVMQ